MFVAPVIDDVDRDSGNLLRSSAGGGKSAAEVGKYLARLNAQITMTHEPAVYIFGSWPETNTSRVPFAMTTWGVGFGTLISAIWVVQASPSSSVRLSAKIKMFRKGSQM